MPKLTEEQLNAIKSLPYYSNVEDLIPLYESGILSQDKFNEELLNARENYKAKPISSGLELVLVKGGIFDMGDEKDQVNVSDFYIGKYQVTQKQYQAVMGKNPSYYKGDNLPVESISWHDAVQFCNKLSEMEGLQKCYDRSIENIRCNFEANGYRLPIEAEWEYAARGGKKSRGYAYSGSNNIDEVAWYNNNSGSKTQPVGTKQPNELGIYDMSGNVWEWCGDWSIKDTVRAIRGGSWHYVGNYCSVANRYYNIPSLKDYNSGFRVARTK